MVAISVTRRRNFRYGLFGFASRGKAIYCFGIALSPYYRPTGICPCSIFLHSLKLFCDTAYVATDKFFG